jgi:hypothetical protein
MFEFKLDFTKSVPPRYCPNAQEAAALYIQHIANAPMDIEFREIRAGLFNITVNSENDKKRLENKSILYDFGEKTHILHTAKVPLVLLKKRVFYQNPKWISIDKLYDSVLNFATHEQLDNYLSKYGQIIVPTHYETDRKTGFRTGKRKARVDLVTDLERWQDVELITTIEGKEISAKGRVNFYYKEQPYFCRDCQQKHQVKCPQKITKELAEKEGETSRLNKATTLLVGDSNLRRVNEKAFFAKTDCATGAKIGHIANNLEYVNKEEHDLVCVHAGQNNVIDEEPIDMEVWQKQTQFEVSELKKNLKKFKNAIIIGVPPAPWCKKTMRTQEMRKKINNAFKSIARDDLNIKYVDIEQEDEDDEANWEDDRHMTEKFTNYMLGKVSEKVEEISGEPFFIRNVKWTAERKYSQVRATYKLGCEVCTILGHSGEICPGMAQMEGVTKPAPAKTSTKENNKKRSKCSGSEDSAPKKI